MTAPIAFFLFPELFSSENPMKPTTRIHPFRSDSAGAWLRPLCAVLVAGTCLVASATDKAPGGKPAPAATAAAAAGDAAAKPQPLMPCPPVVANVLMPATPPELAATVRERVSKRVGRDPASVCRTPFGLFEVLIEGDVYYVDERANYLINGSAIDLRSHANLTQPRREEALRVDFKVLPTALAVKTVRGNGSRTLAIFEDPNCPYCKHFEKEIATLQDVTIYTFLYPILSRDPDQPDDSYARSRAVWCAPDHAAAWSALMLEGKRLTPADPACAHPLEEVLALGHSLHVTGTPTIIFTDGRRAPGAIPLATVEKMMVEAVAAH
jgi:thiol:disulfide interchange protein DsbC